MLTGASSPNILREVVTCSLMQVRVNITWTTPGKSMKGAGGFYAFEDG